MAPAVRPVGAYSSSHRKIASLWSCASAPRKFRLPSYVPYFRIIWKQRRLSSSGKDSDIRQLQLEAETQLAKMFPTEEHEEFATPRDEHDSPDGRRVEAAGALAVDQVGVAELLGKRASRHRNDLLQPGSAGNRDWNSHGVTTGASPNARLDGNCGKRTNAMASISSASIRASGPDRRRRPLARSRKPSAAAPHSSNAARRQEPRLVLVR